MVSQTSNDLAVDLHDVGKIYRGKVHALRGIEMQVHSGEVFGLLGPNGAGKSTLVKIMMTVVRPTRAAGTMLGAPIGHKGTLARVGYLPEHHRFPQYLTGRQTLEFYAALARVDRQTRRKRADELLALVGMSDWANKKVSSYSKGMMQRVGLAQALMNDPELIVLDEPTDGVDPVGRREIRDVLIHLRERGKTVFLNSHLLSELEMVCDRVAILVQGCVERQGSLDDLTIGKQYYQIEVANVDDEQAIRPALPSSIRLLPDEFAAPDDGAIARRIGIRGELATGETFEVEKNIVRVGTTDPEVVQPIIDGLRKQGVVIRSMRPLRPSLEDLFIEAVTDPTTGKSKSLGAAKDDGGRSA